MKVGKDSSKGIVHRGLAARAAAWSANHRKTAIFGWIAFVLASMVLGGAVGQNTVHGADNYSGEAGRAEQALYEAGLRPNSESVFVQSRNLTITDPEYKEVIQELGAGLADAEHVQNITLPPANGAVSADGRSALVEFEITGDDLEAQDRIAESQAAIAAVQADHPRLLVEQFGSVSSQKEIQDVFAEDLLKAGQLSVPITLLILLLAFGSLVAAVVPLGIGLTSVFAAMSLVAIPSQLSPVDSNLSAVILLVGLAVGVDYSLFYLRRSREERRRGLDERASLEIAAATSGRAVVISGLTVMVAMAGMLFTGDTTFISFAQGTILVVAIAVFASLTVLPATLAWLGDRVEKGRIPILGRRRAGGNRLWAALADRVMRRPWLAIAVAGGVLVALAIPALTMNLVVTGTDDAPEDLEVIQTYDRIRDVFPTEGVIVDVAIEGEDLQSGPQASAISDLVQRAEGTDGVLGEPEVTYSDDDSVALVSIPTAGNGNDAESTSVMDAIRTEVIPGTVGATEGLVANVSGNAAQSQDFRDLVSARLPLVFGFVFALAFLLLLVTFRSIVIPLKAIVLNLLSVGAAYGVLVLVFQEGLGEGLLGFESNGGVTSWLPLFLFVLLFGLSMDYHVFILSRIREAHNSGMSTTEAVRHGLTTTAGTVTSAAMVMVAVFAIFATLSFMDFKEMGVGLAVAVLIDATIIRGILMPASMRVLGDWNWYLPRWLEWLPRSEGTESSSTDSRSPVDMSSRHARSSAATPAR